MDYFPHMTIVENNPCHVTFFFNQSDDLNLGMGCITWYKTNIDCSIFGGWLNLLPLVLWRPLLFSRRPMSTEGKNSFNRMISLMSSQYSLLSILIHLNFPFHHRKLMSPPSEPSSQRPSIVVVSNKQLYNNDVPDEAWGSTITMVHPLFQAFNVSCNIGGIPEGTSAGGSGAGASYSQATTDDHRSPPSAARSQFSLHFSESSADTTCGARHLQGLFKGHQSPTLTSAAHSSLGNDRQDLSKEEATNSKQAIKGLDKPIGQTGLGNFYDSGHDFFCLEENTETEESGNFSDDTRKGSNDSSGLDLTEPVVSVSRFHYLI